MSKTARRVAPGASRRKRSGTAEGASDGAWLARSASLPLARPSGPPKPYSNPRNPWSPPPLAQGTILDPNDGENASFNCEESDESGELTNLWAQLTAGPSGRHRDSQDSGAGPAHDDFGRFVELGVDGTLSHRLVFLSRDGPEMSPWHDVPLAQLEPKIVNCICRCPADSWIPYEIAKNEPFNPMRACRSLAQVTRPDNSSANPRARPLPSQPAQPTSPVVFAEAAPWNLGLLPQTWAPALLGKNSWGYGYDSCPLEVLEIGEATQRSLGEVYSVKPLGILPVVEGLGRKWSWKIVAIAADDPWAKWLHRPEDVDRCLPGMLSQIREWLAVRYTSEAKAAESAFPLGYQVRNPKAALAIITEAHSAWRLHRNILPPLKPAVSRGSSQATATAVLQDTWSRYISQSTALEGTLSNKETAASSLHRVQTISLFEDAQPLPSSKEHNHTSHSAPALISCPLHGPGVYGRARRSSTCMCPPPTANPRWAQTTMSRTTSDYPTNRYSGPPSPEGHTFRPTSQALSVTSPWIFLDRTEDDQDEAVTEFVRSNTSPPHPVSLTRDRSLDRSVSLESTSTANVSPPKLLRSSTIQFGRRKQFLETEKLAQSRRGRFWPFSLFSKGAKKECTPAFVTQHDEATKGLTPDPSLTLPESLPAKGDLVVPPQERATRRAFGWGRVA